MISSTVEDLGPERDAAQAAIESVGYCPVRSETEPARGISPEELCRLLAIECDAYVGILGFRYGYVPRGARLFCN